MEEPGIGAVEVDGNHRNGRTLDEFADVLRPGLVFHHRFGADSRAFFLLLVGAHFSGGEEAQPAAGSQVVDGHADARDILPLGRCADIVYRQEAFSQIGDKGQQVVGEEFIVCPDLAQNGAEQQAVHAAEVVVGHGDERALCRDIGQFFGGDIIGDAHIFQGAGGKVRAIIIRVAEAHFIGLVQRQQAVSQLANQAAKSALQAKQALKVIRTQDDFQFFLRFFHTANINIFFYN